jgi:hypothetical protein
MTDRIKGCVVTFEPNMRDDDAEPLLGAIRLMRGVINVDPKIEDFDHQMAVETARSALVDKVWKAVVEVVERD